MGAAPNINAVLTAALTRPQNLVPSLQIPFLCLPSLAVADGCRAPPPVACSSNPRLTSISPAALLQLPTPRGHRAPDAKWRQQAAACCCPPQPPVSHEVQVVLAASAPPSHAAIHQARGTDWMSLMSPSRSKAWNSPGSR